MVPEKKLIYELFAIAGTAEVNPNRVFHSKFVAESTPKLKTKLKDKKLEEQIQGTKDDEAFNFLSTIGQMLDPTISDTAVGDTEIVTDDTDEMVEDDETEKRKEILERRDRLAPRQSKASTHACLQDEMLILDDDACRATTDDVDDVADDADEAVLSDDDVDALAAQSTTRRPSRKKKADTKANDNQISMELGYNRWMRDNIWLAGEECLAKDNVKQGRFEARQRLKKKRTLKKAIEKLQLAGKKSDAFDNEQTVSLPGWIKRMMRKCPDYYS